MTFYKLRLVTVIKEAEEAGTWHVTFYKLRLVTVIKEAEEAGTWHVTFYKLRLVTVIKEAEEAGTWHVTFYKLRHSRFLNSYFPINYSLSTLNLDTGSIVICTIFKESGSKPKKFSLFYGSLSRANRIHILILVTFILPCLRLGR